jgi:acyl transferase domain-containing protein
MALSGELAALLDRRPANRVRPFRKAAFLLAGAGSQHTGMGRALYEQFPVFAAQVDECDRLFAGHLGRSVRELMFGAPADAELLHDIRYTQPAMFTLEYALAQLWLSYTVVPPR